MEPAIPLDDVEFDHSVETTGDVSNMSAEEYLSWVRFQAKGLPLVTRANPTIENKQTRYMPQIAGVLPCPPQYLPSEDWERETIHAFSSLRMVIYRKSLNEALCERKIQVPQMKDINGWYKFCFPSDVANHETITEEPSTAQSRQQQVDNNKRVKKRKRKLAQEYGIDLVDIIQNNNSNNHSNHDSKLNASENDEDNEEGINDSDNDIEEEDDENMVVTTEEWAGLTNVKPTTPLLLQFDQVLTQRVLTYHIEWLEESESLSTSSSRWIYALLSRLEKPICQNTSALLRQLYRRICYLRHHLIFDKDTFDQELASLNILVTIIGSYFGQGGEQYSELNRSLLSNSHNGIEEEEEEDNDDYESCNEEAYYDDEDNDDNGGEVERNTETNSNNNDNDANVIGSNGNKIDTSAVANHESTLSKHDELEEGECDEEMNVV